MKKEHQKYLLLPDFLFSPFPTPPPLFWGGAGVCPSLVFRCFPHFACRGGAIRKKIRLRFTALPNGDKTLAMSWKPVVIYDPGNKEAH